MNKDREKKRKVAKQKRIESSKKMTLASCFVKASNPDLEPPSGDAEEMVGESKSENVVRCDTDIKAVFGDIPGLEIDEEFLRMTFDEQLKAAQRAASDISQKAAAGDDMTVINTEEDVRFGTHGWKNRYYRAKFKVEFDPKNPPTIINTLFHEYVRGLCWVMLYYYQGCSSWSWFFPFHYAPMASDLAGLGDYRIKFDLGQPFRPYGQLMGVLPAASSHALPPAYRKLMSSPDSPIIDFYPTDFRLDLNGKKFQWQAVTLLPFCDQKRLLEAIEPLWDTLTDDQKRMNSFGKTYVFVNAHHPLARTMISLNVECKDLPVEEQKNNNKKINVQESQGMGGYLESYADVMMPGDDVHSYTGKNHTVKNCQVISCVYDLPDFKPHVTCLLPGVEPHKPVLSAKDFDLMRNGRRFGKPRQKRMRRNHSHNDHNRTWGHQRGYQEGNYRGSQRKRLEDDYQHCSGEKVSYQQAQRGPSMVINESKKRGSLFITGQPRSYFDEAPTEQSSMRSVNAPNSHSTQVNYWQKRSNSRYEATTAQNHNWGYVHPPSIYQNNPNFHKGASGGWPRRTHRGKNQQKRKRGFY